MEAQPAFTQACTNLFGKLDAKCQKRLAAVIRNPTSTTWDDAYSLIINGERMMTLWQAWIAVDPTAPRSGPSYDDQGRMTRPWPVVPDQLTLYRAIAHATKARGE